MEVIIINETKDSIQFEIKEEGHTLCNILREELNSLEEVNFASYNIKHPIISSPIMAVNGPKPKKLVLDGADKIKEKTKEFRSLIKKLD